MTMTMDDTSRVGSEPTSPDPPSDAPSDDREPVLLHRRRGALLLVGVAAAAVALAYAWRAIAGGGGAFAAALAIALLPVAALHLAAWWDARVPLLVADETGIRLRTGAAWVGLRWDQVRDVRLAAARLPRRDARLAVGMAAGGDRSLRLSMVDPSDVRALPDVLRRMAPASVDVAVAGPEVVEHEAVELDAVEPEVAEPDAVEQKAAEPQVAEPETAEPQVTDPGAATPEAVEPEAEQQRTAAPRGRGSWWSARSGRSATRAVSTTETADALLMAPTQAEAPRTARADVTITGSPGSVSSALRPVDEPGQSPPPLQLEDAPAAAPRPATARGSEPHPDPEPVSDPVIGPQVASARRHLRLSVDELAERTRIRPHVIESIEVDDFSACGGDVYARGHLRVLARVLGIDPDGLLQPFDERYASAPVTARSVLEAELASSGRVVDPSTGPRWSVLIGVVVVLALLWAGAQLLVSNVDEADNVTGSGSTPQQRANSAASGSPANAADRFSTMGRGPGPVWLRLAAAPGAVTSTPLTVTAKGGQVLFDGVIAPGAVERIKITDEATITATDGSLVLVQVDGRRVGRLGTPGEPVRRTLGG